MRINRFWEGRGFHLGRIWNCLGHLSEALGRLLAVLGDAGIEFFPTHGPSWSPRGLWDGFWEGLDKVLGVLGLMLAHFSLIFRVLGAPGASWVRSCVRESAQVLPKPSQDLPKDCLRVTKASKKPWKTTLSQACHSYLSVMYLFADCFQILTFWYVLFVGGMTSEQYLVICDDLGCVSPEIVAAKRHWYLDSFFVSA